MRRATILSLCVVLLASSMTFGRGLLIPTDKSLPPLAIKTHRVNVTIDSQLAVTKVEQVFQNNTDRVLEATYIFPLPPGATINDFAMFINGKRMSGQLVEKTQARQIYTDIVRRMRDPGILEYIGGNLFKLNVYPIPANGRQKLEVEYSEVLKRDSGMHKYTYPLKTEEAASQTLDDFTVGITLKSKDPITNIYSPSHKMGIARKGENEAVIGFEQDKALLDRDVVLYYTVSDKSFGMNLMTHRPEKDKDGYFMMLITPRAYFKDADILPRDVCFVLDTSGSMQTDNKMRQAKEALKYCVSSLNEKDRFTVIAFSTAVNPMSTTLLDATAVNQVEATLFIEKQEAMGGTAIHSALVEALSIKRVDETERPYVVVFLTDGRPTIGEDRTDEIVKAVGVGQNVRIFTWGVGHDVNAHLLDRIASETRAVSEYVEPKESIEQKVSLFFNKMSKPVLASPKIAWGKAKVHDVYPGDIGDLFAGQQVTVFGRYSTTGDAAVTLEGAVKGKKATQTFEGTFGADAGNSFIEKLWASRHVGFLLDEIRLRGEKPELKDEVIRLSRTYGIQTPYTSYLVLETKEEYAKHGISYHGGDALGVTTAGRTTPATTPAPTTGYRELRQRLEDERRRVRGTAGEPADAGKAKATVTDAIRRADRAGAEAQSGAALDAEVKHDLPPVMKAPSGEDAVKLAKDIAALKRGESAEDGRKSRESLSLVKRIDERSFYWYAGFWVDGEFTDKLPQVHVKYLSDGYFKVLEKRPELKDAFALGERLIIVSGKAALIIDDEGKEDVTAAELNSLLAK